jgi:hypothetical protein
MFGPEGMSLVTEVEHVCPGVVCICGGQDGTKSNPAPNIHNKIKEKFVSVESHDAFTVIGTILCFVDKELRVNDDALVFHEVAKSQGYIALFVRITKPG